MREDIAGNQYFNRPGHLVRSQPRHRESGWVVWPQA